MGGREVKSEGADGKGGKNDTGAWGRCYERGFEKDACNGINSAKTGSGIRPPTREALACGAAVVRTQQNTGFIYIASRKLPCFSPSPPTRPPTSPSPPTPASYLSLRNKPTVQRDQTKSPTDRRETAIPTLTSCCTTCSTSSLKE